MLSCTLYNTVITKIGEKCLIDLRVEMIDSIMVPFSPFLVSNMTGESGRVS